MNNKMLFVFPAIAIVVLLSGCVFSSNNMDVSGSQPAEGEPVTVTGTAAETKDGYYVADYVLDYAAIEAYNDAFVPGEYNGKKIEVVGKGKEVNPECTPDIQCRQGPYQVIYDIESIKLLNE